MMGGMFIPTLRAASGAGVRLRLFRTPCDVAFLMLNAQCLMLNCVALRASTVLQTAMGERSYPRSEKRGYRN